MAQETALTAYRAGIDDIGYAPLFADNALPAADNADPADPAKSEGEFRRAVIQLLTEIRDALLASPEG